MSTIGARERTTQNRVVKRLQDLGYHYLGNWQDRQLENSNVEEALLRAWLERRGVPEALIPRTLHKLANAARSGVGSLYDRNREVYDLLRYGVKIQPDQGEQTVSIDLIDWEDLDNNDFAIAEEVAIPPADPQAYGKRPDVVLYVNGIALGVLELKRSTVSVAEGIRQNLDNQKAMFIEHFFTTMQLVMAGNDTEGLRYGTIKTPEKYYLSWKEPSDEPNPLDSALQHICTPIRFLELIRDFIVFDAGTKKLCRHNQYFGIKAAQEYLKRREGGIIWHTQGSGKSLTMVWLARWIRRNMHDARVLIITDRTELDEQIEKVFKNTNEHDIKRTRSGADLLETLNSTTPWLVCSLVHKFGHREDDEEIGDYAEFIKEMNHLPEGFHPKGNLVVFVDECHRTQSGDLHKAMKQILPEAIFIGFTGTPLLKADKNKRSIEVFGSYIHTYKYNEAVQDKVVLDLRYEARDIAQTLTSRDRIDQWFDAKTKGLTPLAQAQLKQKWGTMQQVLSSQSRLQKIANDILLDMEIRDRLKSGYGNAILVAGSIYEACKFYEIFSRTPLADACAIITSFTPNAAAIRGQATGEGDTERLEQYKIYRDMLARWFREPPETAVNKTEQFELEVKRRFINEPGQMKLLIVVDKLLTGFDAPSATYLYIDKKMRDHGLFQAICRVNRLDSEDKEYGYIVDYQDLFKSLETAINDYTSGALDGYDKEDVAGLLEDRVQKGRERLEDMLESIRALCEPVEPPKDDQAFYQYFSAQEHGNAEQLKANEPRRLALYKTTASLIRAYANLASEMLEAGYTLEQAKAIKDEVAFYESLRNQVKLHSGDAIDLKQYEPAMRHLIDSYIRAEDSVQVSAFEDLSLIELVVQRGPDAIQELPKGLRNSETAVAETIENNVRKLIIDEMPINPKYYERMSELLDALIDQRKRAALDYQQYLQQITELTRQVKQPKGDYPANINTASRRALYDNLEQNEALAISLDNDLRLNIPKDFRTNKIKLRTVRNTIAKHIVEPATIDRVLELVKAQHEY